MLESFDVGVRKTLSTPGVRPELSVEQSEGKLLDEVDKNRDEATTGSVGYLPQATRDVMLTKAQFSRAMPKPSNAHVATMKHERR